MLLYIHVNIAIQIALKLSKDIDLPRTYLAHHELESVIIIKVIKIIKMTKIAGTGKNGCQRDWHRAPT